MCGGVGCVFVFLSLFLFCFLLLFVFVSFVNAIVEPKNDL